MKDRKKKPGRTVWFNVAYEIILSSQASTHLCLLGSDGSFGFLLDFVVLLGAGWCRRVCQMRNGTRAIHRLYI